MKNEVVKYGLWHKKAKSLLSFYTVSNEGASNAVSVSHSLELGNHNENVWLVDSEKSAEYVRTHKTSWYNAMYETPEHNYKEEDLEVVKLSLNFEVKND